jgi:hypothetical protein
MVLIRKGYPPTEYYERATFDIVRFNVDTDPFALPQIVPVASDAGKRFEKIWTLNEVPYKGQFFGGQE